MALPDGNLWPFCVVIAKSDARLRRYSYRDDAEAEAERLAQKEGAPMCVFRLISRFDPIVTPVHKQLPGPEPLRVDVGFTPGHAQVTQDERASR